MERVPWTYATARAYIQMSHIICHWPKEGHDATFRRMHALFSFCEHEVYKDRLQEVWNFVSIKQPAEWPGKGHNEVALWILQMVYAEVFLRVDVDWRTIPGSVRFVHRERWVPSAILPEWRRVGGMPQVAPRPQPNPAQQLQLGRCDPVAIAHRVPMAGPTNQPTPPNITPP